MHFFFLKDHKITAILYRGSWVKGCIAFWAHAEVSPESLNFIRKVHFESMLLFHISLYEDFMF